MVSLSIVSADYILRKTLAVRKWRKRADDHEEWAIVLKEAVVKL
jgi:hypothetical protein